MPCRSWLPRIPYRNLGLKMGYMLEMTMSIMITIHSNIFPLNFQTSILFHSLALCNLVPGDAQNQRVNRFDDSKTASKMRSAVGLSLLDVSVTSLALSSQCDVSDTPCFQVQDAGAGNLEKGHLLCVNCAHFISFHLISVS